MSRLKSELRFRMTSIVVIGLAAIGLARIWTHEDRTSRADVGSPIMHPATPGIERAGEAVVSVEVPSTLETDAAAEVEKINSGTFQPFVAGDPSSTQEGER